MRVVLDTNVLARATPGRNSPARQVFDALLVEPHVLVSSEFLLNELGRALRYQRVRAIHGLDDTAIDAYVQAIRDASLVVTFATPIQRPCSSTFRKLESASFAIPNSCSSCHHLQPRPEFRTVRRRVW